MEAASHLLPSTASSVFGGSASLGAARTAPEAAASTPDQALVQRIQRGDRQAFAALVQEHQQVVYGFLRARLLVATDAEDLTQEVFLRCYLGHEKLDRTVNARAWLIGVARNLLCEHVRRVKRRREEAWTELCLELDNLIQHPDAIENEALRFLPVCLESLGTSAREALDMHYHAQLRLAEIGTRLKRSEGAVKLLMYRARQALKHCLDGKLKRDHSAP